jgi:hypothetical protein
MGMHRWALLALATSALLCGAVAACGFSGAGLGSDEATDDGGSSDHTSPMSDAGGGRDSQGQPDAPAISDAPADTAPLTDAATCVASLPMGWTVVQYETSQMPCPQAGMPHKVVTNPILGAGACTCTCNDDMPPSCSTGMLATNYSSSDNSCQNQGAVLPINGPGCEDLGSQTLAPHSSAEALSISGGHCKTMGQQNDGALAKTPVAFCDVPGPNQEAVCGGGSAPNFEACIVSDGDVPCPGQPFSTRTVVYDDVMLQCGACGACVVGGTCQNATITFFADTGNPPCDPGDLVFALVLDGQCHPDGFTNNAPFRYIEYAASLVPAGGSCTVAPPSAAMMPTHPRTVCCRN